MTTPLPPFDNSSTTPEWRPSAALSILQARAQLYRDIREFFFQRQVLEVETPILSSGCTPEPTIEPLMTVLYGCAAKACYLRTSPELAMKRLLAAGSGAIFQLCKVFRDGEIGKQHNPEFTLLEWYRPDFDDLDLIKEVDEFLQLTVGAPPAVLVDYCDAFTQYTGLSALDTELTVLQTYATELGMYDAQQLERDDCVRFIMAEKVEPAFDTAQPTIIKNFPATQASLARKKEDNPQLSARFEVYWQGLELANGFHELGDSQEQTQRFIKELEYRERHELPDLPLDERFLAALEAGLPPCAGVAVGVDRLLMIKTKMPTIQSVLSFDINRI